MMNTFETSQSSGSSSTVDQTYKGDVLIETTEHQLPTSFVSEGTNDTPIKNETSQLREHPSAPRSGSPPLRQEWRLPRLKG
jgi:hypothetical protein